MPAVGDYLQERRNAAHLTQREVAQQLGVDQKTVSDWEAGRYVPGFDLMARLIRIIGGRIEEATRLLLEEDDLPMTEEQLIASVDTDPKRIVLLRRILKHSDDPILIARIESYLQAVEDRSDA